MSTQETPTQDEIAKAAQTLFRAWQSYQLEDAELAVSKFFTGNRVKPNIDPDWVIELWLTNLPGVMELVKPASAYEQGRSAWRHGKDYLKNPFPIDTAEHHDWNTGWDSIQAESEYGDQS